MRKIAFAVPFCMLLLSACDPAPQPATDQPVATTSAEAEAPSAMPGPADQKLAAALPSNTSLDVPFEIRRENAYKAKDGTPRKSISIEFMTGDARSIHQAVEKSFSEAGYQPVGRVKRLGKDRYSRTYSRANSPSIEVVANSSAGLKRNNREAAGVVRFDWAQ